VQFRTGLFAVFLSYFLGLFLSLGFRLLGFLSFFICHLGSLLGYSFWLMLGYRLYFGQFSSDRLLV
jgi:hypothetical protein